MKKIIISILNRYLEQDSERAISLRQIKDKVIRVVVREINLDIKLKVNDSSFEEIQLDDVADVEISVSLKILPDFLMGVDQDKLIKNGSIEIKGDTHVASVMQNTLKEIEVDWEEIISKYTSDSVAHQIGKGARAFHSFADRLRDNMRQDMRDFLQDNIQVSATQEEVDQFIKEVDATRAQTDRIEARINKLQARD